MSTPYRQLHLPIELRREPTLEEYLPGPNSEAVAAITAIAQGAGEPFIFVFGAAGTGKTHLLQAACLAAGNQGRKAHFLPLTTPGLDPRVLENLERLDLVAIDDIQSIVGDARWEETLFALFNRMRDQGKGLIMAASAAPDALGVHLPDLASRLLWGPRYCLQPLSDEDCACLMTESAARRGLRLGPDIVRFVMNRYPRDPASLMEVIARVDSVSLREQRQPTIPLVRRAMEPDD
ncbi:DnaA regulatory inactivator Hda [Thiorhodococcus mannitoliphagus]|uniref:DnaA regulatory inactivator Hda n=1 Tax=Thiorhodococcus mannitoliphagus TaxID=329406 RepID=A0A6P1DZR7_9GAMM|nr:DnaA regulatory inactivator Hda [Thiorhodococcus mannitoliphagus]NEX22521.1 DnaA regulatory inactivator Hda [Thiorhodococcus mannitoliphagus]